MEVLGAISSVVAIVEATVNSYKAIKKIRDRPEAFNTVGQQLRSVRDLLNEIHDKTKDNDSAIKTAQNEEFIRGVKECQTKAEALENIFRHLEEKCNNSEESERVWPDHFKNIYKALLKGSKANRVETLMADLWKGIERLAVIKIIGMSDPVQRNVKSAIQYLEEDDPSLDDSEFDSTGIHATQNIATGGTGTQNNVRGDNNIFNSGSFSGGKFGTFNNYGGKAAPSEDS
ncbi:hypothetical protein K4K54_004827 [Colletotrichum sp. SAR 10_86]|nr:hypothetical protein K4K52_004800 [Colletotrichum sp. SAR 10_76]KAI8225115.1 hypothetical protein K4K54_004827 [Colletotrichum sp. SAR 10_86]